MLFLKSEEAVKVTVLQDLDAVFMMIKQAETKIFVDRSFKYKIFFQGISQYKHCMARMEASKVPGEAEVEGPVEQVQLQGAPKFQMREPMARE